MKLKFDGIKEIWGCSNKSGKRHLSVLNIVSGAVLCEVLGINVHTNAHHLTQVLLHGHIHFLQL